jgi:hypothetical protein
LIAIVLAAISIAPDPALADGRFVKGVVIGKNDHGTPLQGVSVQSETTVGGKPCLLRRTRTGKKGSFRVPLDPACPFLTLKFSKAGYLDAIIEVNNLAGDNDVGPIELQSAISGPSRPPVKAARHTRRTILIVAIIAVTSVATAAAVKH